MAAAEGKLLPAIHPATLLVEKTGRKVAKAAQELPEDGRGYIEHMKVRVSCVPAANDADKQSKWIMSSTQEASSQSTQLAPGTSSPRHPHTDDMAA